MVVRAATSDPAFEPDLASRVEAGDGAAPARPWYRNYVLVMVIIGFALNFLDRQILTILLQPIKQELHLSDTVLGFLSGFAFALFYAALGVPLARLADRRSRRVIMSVSMAVWCGMTALCGMAQNTVQLFLARFGVGVGEAGFTPAGMTLVADYFPESRRNTALGFVNIGPMLGMMLGLMIGGWAVGVVGWRGAFLIAGLPGLAFALLFALTVKDPFRTLGGSTAAEARAELSFLQGMRELWSDPAYRWLILGCGFSAFGLYGFSIWMPSFRGLTG